MSDSANADVFFHETGRIALYVVQMIINTTIVALMSANTKFTTKFQQWTYSMVWASEILVVLGFLADLGGSFMLEEMMFKITKGLFIAFNYGICLQLNESLNYSSRMPIIVVIICIAGIVVPLGFGSWKGTYFANIALSVFALTLLADIKKKATAKGTAISMELMSMFRLECIILFLNCIVAFVFVTSLINYENAIIWGTKSCIWSLYMLKVYILTVYFSGDSSNASRKPSVADNQYAKVHQNDPDV